MSSIKVDLGVPYAKIYQVDELVGAVATKDYACPANRRWRLLDGAIERDTSATFNVYLFNADSHRFHELAAESAGTTTVDIPSVATNKMNYGGPIVLQAGDFVRIVWGVAQTNPRVVLRFLEIAY